jgi:hypothetical protein
MTWIATATGTEVSLRHPQPGTINLRTIAHHLSLINRFTGATCRPYSVAEHSLLVCKIAEIEFQLDVHGLFAALMHDAHEAFVNDLATPVKDEVGATWHTLESRFVRVIRNGFALHVASTAHAKAIKQSDLIALATERAQLLPASATPWSAIAGVKPVAWVNLMSPACRNTPWTTWRNAFIERADSLDFQRQQFAQQLGR